MRAVDTRGGRDTVAKGGAVMDNEEERQALPTYQQIESLGREIAVKCASNQSELFARIFYNAGLSAEPDLAVRCIWLVEAIGRFSPLGTDRERIGWPVSNEDAFSLGFTGYKMSCEGVVSLACFLYQLERSMGSDHQAIQPIRWERRGLLQRAHGLGARQEGEKWNS